MIFGPAAPQPPPNDQYDAQLLGSIRAALVTAFLFLFGGD